ncbi:hypothetical protein T4E_5480 [Trichinella pseudospiralis]|uniref:Uncharacterized protein n=1 Tax=Trichinella pseudospiralis TaxID=6337 RepID=A0A0V0XJW0_TRIPS|nr:hypothetical protein T4E_5480 [Trichinella pseudospiralis]
MMPSPRNKNNAGYPLSNSNYPGSPAILPSDLLFQPLHVMVESSKLYMVITAKPDEAVAELRLPAERLKPTEPVHDFQATMPEDVVAHGKLTSAASYPVLDQVINGTLVSHLGKKTIILQLADLPVLTWAFFASDVGVATIAASPPRYSD